LQAAFLRRWWFGRYKKLALAVRIDAEAPLMAFRDGRGSRESKSSARRLQQCEGTQKIDESRGKSEAAFGWSVEASSGISTRKVKSSIATFISKISSE
jgi:hypothetical protein